jgi:hypothetical protein
MRHSRNQSGAVAVIVALLATVLLGLAAVAVDLGNAWARKRQMQTQVDVVAVSAGALLPATDATKKDAIAQEVAAYFNKAANKIVGQQDTLFTGSQFLDGQMANGEVLFEKPDGTPDPNTMRVVAPEAKVDFGFAGIFSGGPNSVDVSQQATVQIRTPLPKIDDVLPMWLPGSCMYGETTGDAGPADPGASPTFTQNSPRGNHETGPISPATAVYGTTASVSVSITNIPKDRTGATIRFTFGDGKVIDKKVTWPSPTTTADGDRTVTVAVGTEITSTPGDWQVWPLVTNSASPSEPPDPLPVPLSGVDYPKNNKEGKFTVTGGGEVACADGERGNFGQLDSPRVGVSPGAGQLQRRYALNVALGLDHKLAPFEDPASYVCTADGSPEGALIDDHSEDGRNCLYVQPGNDPGGLTNGLLDGVDSYPGRLKASEPSACGRATTNLPHFGQINNDTLSCYLKPGYTLADVAKDSDVPLDAFDASIFDSPRFFWLPVVYQGDRTEKKYLAIKTFVPAFLTDETRTSSKSSTDASSNNGIVLNGGGTQIQSIQLFAFNVAALPVNPNADTVDYQGGRGVVRLID